MTMLRKLFCNQTFLQPTNARRTDTDTRIHSPGRIHAHTQAAGEPAERSYEAPAGDNTSERGEVCVCLSVLGCAYPCVYPSCARWLVAKKFGCKRVFAASSSCITLPTASYNLRLNLTDPTSQACRGQTTYCCRSAGRQGCRQSEAVVKRSDLANFDPDTPLEKLPWAREKMQRNFQQPMSAHRTARPTHTLHITTSRRGDVQ